MDSQHNNTDREFPSVGRYHSIECTRYRHAGKDRQCLGCVAPQFEVWYSGGPGTEPLWYVCLDADTREECEIYIGQHPSYHATFKIVDTKIEREDCPYCKAKASMVADWVKQTVTCLQCGTVELPDHEFNSLIEHTKDTDCTVDPETSSCVVCGVDHSVQCPRCIGRGFHVPTCPHYSAY